MNNFILALRLSSFFVFVGRAWQHLIWDAPYRALLWDEGLLRPVVELWPGLTWQAYSTHPLVDSAIQNLIRGTGVFYLICAVLSLSDKSVLRKLGWVISIGSLSLFVLACLYCKEKFMHVGQLVEYSAQFCTPFFLYLVVSRDVDPRALIRPIQIAIALTFAGHGLYAVGVYPIPGNFIDMTIALLGVSDQTAVNFLLFAGILDLVLAAAIFWLKIAVPFLVYASFWGLATALARLFAHVDSNFLLASLNEWLPEVLFRLPHAGLPIALLFLLKALR